MGKSLFLNKKIKGIFRVLEEHPEYRIRIYNFIAAKDEEYYNIRKCKNRKSRQGEVAPGRAIVLIKNAIASYQKHKIRLINTSGNDIAVMEYDKKTNFYRFKRKGKEEWIK